MSYRDLKRVAKCGTRIGATTREKQIVNVCCLDAIERDARSQCSIFSGSFFQQ